MGYSIFYRKMGRGDAAWSVRRSAYTLKAALF